MKLKVSFLISILLFSLTGYSQDQKTHMNFTLLIDNEIVETGIYDGAFQIKDSLNNVLDNIPFKYLVGDLVLNPEDCEKLKTLKSGLILVITFKYRQICPNVKEFVYLKELPLSWLFQRYMIFKVYNFTNKKNYGYFKERTGYGVEITIPGKGIVIPRKTNKINNCN